MAASSTVSPAKEDPSPEGTSIIQKAQTQPTARIEGLAPTITPQPTPFLTATPVSVVALGKQVTPSPPVPTVAIPTAVPGTKRIVVIDPGHGGNEVGAVSRGPEPRLVEKDLNLAVAKQIVSLLEIKGYSAILTRSSDTSVNSANRDLNGDGRVDVDDDLQARVDLANGSKADLLVSVHHNGSETTSLRGITTYYCKQGPNVAASLQLAALIQSSLEKKFGAFDRVPGRGVQDDAGLGKRYGHLFLLGFKTPRVARTPNMPAALGEALFLSNESDVKLLKRPEVQRSEAEGYAEAIDSYFRKG